MMRESQSFESKRIWAFLLLKRESEHGVDLAMKVRADADEKADCAGSH